MSVEAVCRCGAGEHPNHLGRCGNGHVLVGNQAAFKTGVRSFEQRGPLALQADLRQSVEDFRAQVIADRGGIEGLTAIEAGLIRRLSELETVSRLLSGNLVQYGIFTKSGRVRSVYPQWLATLDRWDRFAQRVGVERKPKRVSTLQEYLDRPADIDQRAVEEVINESTNADRQPGG